MFRKRGDAGLSNFPVSEPNNIPESYEEFLQQVEKVFEEEPEEFLMRLKKRPAGSESLS